MKRAFSVFRCVCILSGFGLQAAWNPIEWPHYAIDIPKASIAFTSSRKFTREISVPPARLPLLSFKAEKIPLRKPILSHQPSLRFGLKQEQRFILKSGYTFDSDFATRARKIYGSLNYYVTPNLSLCATPDMPKTSANSQKAWELHFLLNLSLE